VADGRVTADFTLSVGDTAQAIEVVAASAEVLNTVSGEIARVVDADQVRNLALNGRNFIQLATLIPGSVITDADQLNLYHQPECHNTEHQRQSRQFHQSDGGWFFQPGGGQQWQPNQQRRYRFYQTR